MWRHWLVVGMCAVAWVTVIAVRTRSIGDYSAERWFTIGVAAIAMYVAGLTVQKIIERKREADREHADPASE